MLLGNQAHGEEGTSAAGRYVYRLATDRQCDRLADFDFPEVAFPGQANGGDPSRRATYRFRPFFASSTGLRTAAYMPVVRNSVGLMP